MNFLDYLQKIGLNKIRVYGNRIMACCPFHDDRNPSLSIDTEKNLWFCFACAEGGTLKSFIKKYEGLSYNQIDAKYEISVKETTKSRVLPEINWDLILNNLSKTLVPALLVKKQITQMDMEKFGVGLVLKDISIKTQTGKEMSLWNWLAFMVKDWQGIFKGFIFRKSSLKDKIFYMSKTLMPYFWGEWLIDQRDFVILVEGITDAIFLHKKGLPAIALCGTQLNETRFKRLLEQGFKAIVIFLDPDAELKAKQLVSRFKLAGVNSIRYIIDKDPDEMSELEIEKFKDFIRLNACPFLEGAMQKGFFDILTR